MVNDVENCFDLASVAIVKKRAVDVVVVGPLLQYLGLNRQQEQPLLLVLLMLMMEILALVV